MTRGRNIAGKTKQVEALTHAQAKRKNIPTAELQSAAQRAEELKPFEPVVYPRRYPLAQGEIRARDKDIDPQIIWKGTRVRLTAQQIMDAAAKGYIDISPRVVGYRVELPEEKLRAKFTDDHRLVLTPGMVGPGQTLLEGIVGEGVTLSAAEMKEMRPSTVSFELAKFLLYSYFRDGDGEPKLNLFYQIQRIVRRWIDEGYLVCKGDTGPWMLGIKSIAAQAAERIRLAIENEMGDQNRTLAVLDPYNPKGSSRHVGFMTSKELYATSPTKCNVNYVVTDSGWEAEFARAAEAHPRVISYVKNQGLGLEVPYRDGSTAKHYVPDFIVQIDDGKGRDDPLNLVVEVKGYRAENVKLKSETMRQQWIRGVNNLGTYGRWAFIEFGDVYEMQEQFEALIDRALMAQSNPNHGDTND